MVPPISRRRNGASVAVVLLLALVAGCGNPAGGTQGAADGVAASTTVAASPNGGLPTLPPAPAIVWSPCGTGSAIQCGTVSVPVDYRHPHRASIAVAVTRATALDPSGPRGTLVFNPGGPGESGNQILPVALSLLPPTIRREFDIVSFDPRGTGASDPLRCGTSPSVVTSADPVPTAPGRPLPGSPAFTTMARACQAEAPGLEPFVDTTDTARDLDRIRQSLGLATISFYGMSYGTVLGAVYAGLFPHRVATMVLDGAVDINAPLARQADEQAPGAEHSLDHLLATCAATLACPLGPDPKAFFSGLAASLTRRPLPAPGAGDAEPVTVGDLDTATLFALGVTGSTSSYYSALVAADHGNGAPLRAIALESATDIDGAPLVDPQWAITCNDTAAHPGPIAAGSQATALQVRYPLIGAYAVVYNMGGCVSWPAGRQPVEDVHPAGAPPVLVVGNTGDPITPLIGARHLAAVFPVATLLTWAAWGHTWLLSGSDDTCMSRAVTTYLTGGGLPPAGTVCH
jgi:pimeloyl-ACP methyl ester carboxylesterase